MANFNPIIPAKEDGLIIPDIGNWGEQKYNLVGHYCNIFTTAMRNKWNLIYIDLFSGAGYARIRETKVILKTSSLIAMSIPIPFDHYMLCEYDLDKFTALKSRAEKEKVSKPFTVDYFQGDSNENIDEIIRKIPQYNNEKGNLIFCFVDPFSLNLHFDTIKKLAQKKVDFLILLALQMDANRNLQYYYQDQSEKIDKYLANPVWREEFKNTKTNNSGSFIKFLSDQYDKNMISIGYQVPLKKEQIRMSKNSGAGLYYLAFYSKHPRGNDFFQKIRKSANEQYPLF